MFFMHYLLCSDCINHEVVVHPNHLNHVEPKKSPFPSTFAEHLLCSFTVKDIVLTTQRCRLRRLSRDDAPFVVEASQTPGFTDGMRWEPMKTEEETHEFTDLALSLWGDSKYVWTIEEKESSTFIGRIEIGRLKDYTENVWEIGYWIHPAQQGKGYATEAAMAVLQFAFETRKVDAIYSTHHDWNEASGKVLRKIGMKHTGYEEEKTVKRGKPVRSAEFWLSREDWNQQ